MNNFLVFFSIALFIYSCNKKPYPNRYSLTEQKGLSTPREQAWGTCWAHASVASLESNMILKGIYLEKEKPNLSEYHMDKYSGFTRKGADEHVKNNWYSGQGSRYLGSNKDDLNEGLVVHLGGDYRMSASYLSNFGGAVIEKQNFTTLKDNDHELFGDRPDEGVLIKNDYSYYMPKHIEWISFERNYKKLSNLIKKNIVENGSVASAQKMNKVPLGLSPLDGREIHCDEKTHKPNHAINIIGWDDDLFHNGKRGAWIIRDSDHKDEKTKKHIHYFYVMYDDFIVGKDKWMGGVVFKDVFKTNFNNIYSHSLHGWRHTLLRPWKEVANQFLSRSEEYLNSLSFYTTDFNTEVSLRVYKGDLNSKHQLIYQSKIEVFSNPGFHYFELDKKILLNKNEKFAVSIAVSNKSFAHDRSFEMELLLGAPLPIWGKPIFVRSKSARGESYYRDRKGSWNDFLDFEEELRYELINTGNFAINAFTVKNAKE
jgi:hypothetical protein